MSKKAYTLQSVQREIEKLHQKMDVQKSKLAAARKELSAMKAQEKRLERLREQLEIEHTRQTMTAIALKQHMTAEQFAEFLNHLHEKAVRLEAEKTQSGFGDVPNCAAADPSKV